MPRTLVAILLSSLCLAGCHTSTVHKNTWFEEDGWVVRKEAPAGSTLPAAQASSYASVRFGVRVNTETDALGAAYMRVVVADQPTAIKPEPQDLDVAVRVDGEPGSWISRVQLFRSYKPLNVPKETGTLIRFHKINWMQNTVVANVETGLTGDPVQPRVEADVYLEYWLVGREYIDGNNWCYVFQFRSRIESEHPDWEVSESELVFEARGGMKITLPLFPREE